MPTSKTRLHQLFWRLSGLALVLGLASIPSASEAQVFPEVGSDETVVLDEEIGTAYPAALVYNPDLDVYLVVAEDEGTRIVAQFLDSDSTPMGGSFGLGSDPTRVGRPAVAYDSVNERYLVTWFRRTGDGFRVMARVLNSDGSNFFGPFVISSPCGTADYWRECNGGIAFNPTTSEYLVTWFDINQTGPSTFDAKVLARRVRHDGALLGTELTLGSHLDSLGSPPRVVYNPLRNSFLVAWAGVSNGTYGIYYRTLNASGVLTSVMTRISSVDDFRLDFPDVVFNTVTGEYLVVWQQPLSGEGTEIVGQRLEVDGNQIGTNDFRISDMGPAGDTVLKAEAPRVSFNSDNGRYLIAWRGDDAVVGEVEIFVQYLGPDAGSLPPNDFKISEMGGSVNPAFDANQPSIAYGPLLDEFLVVWSGDDVVDNEFLLYGQRIDGTGYLFADGFESGSTSAWGGG